MSTDRETTRVVRSWLEEGVTALPDRVLDSVLDQLPATPQRRSGWPAWRSLEMNNPVRLAIAAAAVLVVALVGYQLLPSNAGSGGTPTPSPTLAPTPSAPPTPTTTPAPTLASPGVLPLEGGPLAPGRYTLASFPVTLSVEVPAGWESCVASASEQGVCRLDPDTAGVAFLLVTNVVADPCSEALADPPVGPTVDDLVAAISSLKGFTATTPRDIEIDGFAGKEFTVTAPVASQCGLLTWATADRTNGVGLNEANLVRIVDVGGTRVFISIAYDPTLGGFPADVQPVLDSIRLAR